LPVDWGALEWHWRVPDILDRIRWSRRNPPSDIFTLLAISIVYHLGKLIEVVMLPVDYASRKLGQLSVLFVGWGLILFFLMTALWIPFWGLLMGSSWLWLRYPLTRPLLLIPGVPFALILTIVLMLVPDPEKQKRYVSIAQVWPLTWNLWQPPEQYYIDEGVSDDDNPYAWERAFGSAESATAAAAAAEPQKYDPEKTG
jgi:hypothetical protein